jgi:hypothetical protein
MYEPGSIDLYPRRRFDIRALAAARRVAADIGMPTDDGSLPSVFLRVAEADPLLHGPDPIIRRTSFLMSLNTNGSSRRVEVGFPFAVRHQIELAAEQHIYAWKLLENDPIKYMMAALLEMFGQ